MKRMTLSLMVASLLLTQCSPGPSDSTVQEVDFKKKIERQRDENTALLSLHLLSFVGSTFSTVPRTKDRYLVAVTAILAGHQSLNLALVGSTGRGLMDHSFGVLDAAGSLSMHIEHGDLIRQLRRYQEFYTQIDLDDLVNEKGDVSDTFLKDLLITSGYEKLRPQAKREFIRQVQTVLTLDESPTHEQLVSLGIIDPIAKDLNLAMNGVRRGISIRDYSQERLEQLERAGGQGIAILGVNTLAYAGISSRAANTHGDKGLAVSAIVASALGASAVGNYLAENRIFGVFEEGKDEPTPLNDVDLAMFLNGAKFHLLDKTIDDLIDSQGQVTDDFSQIFLHSWAGDEQLTAQHHKKALEQLLVIMKAEDDISHEVLMHRGITDARFLVIFDNWQQLKKKVAAGDSQ